MKNSTNKSIMLTAAVALAAGSANAAIHQAHITSPGHNSNGGVIQSITTTYNDVTDRLDWSVTFSNQVTEGFTLAISDGPNPKNDPGQMALFYFDASDMGNAKLTAYGYNGRNAQDSHIDGVNTIAGNQTPDLIMTDLQLATGDTKISVDDNIDGTRTLGFSIDATTIIDHIPMYPDTGTNPEPWTGASFADRIGIWFHTFKTFDATYDSNGNITDFNKGGEGWFDGSNIQTQMIPLPGAAAMTLAGLGLVSRRRRNSIA